MEKIKNEREIYGKVICEDKVVRELAKELGKVIQRFIDEGKIVETKMLGVSY